MFQTLLLQYSRNVTRYLYTVNSVYIRVVVPMQTSCISGWFVTYRRTIRVFPGGGKVARESRTLRSYVYIVNVRVTNVSMRTRQVVSYITIRLLNLTYEKETII